MKRRFCQVRAVMARRILVNFRVRPDTLQRRLPPPFQPKQINGWGLGGICLIRLQHMRPSFLPAAMGFSSENAAHRIAVEWTDSDTTREGVFIPRRDTDSIINLLAGGRLFPGEHHLARFHCSESNEQFKVQMRSRDGTTSIAVEANLTTDWPATSVFPSLKEASAFLKSGNCGWSPHDRKQCLEGVELHTDFWEMHPLTVSRVESSFFADQSRFPSGSVEFDSALLMQGIPHTWRALEPQRHSPSSQTGPHHTTRAFLELP